MKLHSLLVGVSLSLAAAGSAAFAAPAPPETPGDPVVAATVARVRTWHDEGAGAGVSALDEWKFKKGDVAGAESPQLDDSSWTTAHVGDEWGPQNSAAWFRRWVVIPDKIGGDPTSGRKVILDLSVDDDGVVYVDGKKTQSFHWDEGAVVLTSHARPGKKFFVAIKGINGPGTGRLFRADLTLAGVITPRSSAQDYLDSETFTLWMEKASPALAPDLERRERAAAAEIPPGPLNALAPAVLKASFDRAVLALADPAARRLRDNLVGYAHTDIDWLWQWPETKEVWYHTGMTLLGLMKQFPDLHFSQSQAVMYQAMKEEHPDLFHGIQAAVRAGRWEPLNGWCENDMNMPSGESEIRQALLSNEFYKSELGVTSSICWRPDSFGHAWTLPMILKSTGVDSYYFCRAGHNVPVFWWESPDGSRILAFNDPGWYNASILPTTPSTIVQQTDRIQSPEWMTVYGVGDHGGGPTRADINEAHHLGALPAMPRMQFETAAETFKRLRKAEPRGGYPVISDEMNPTFQGCYTSHVDTKRLNRQLEQTLYAAETWSSVAALMGRPYPAKTLRSAWYDTLRNQFHDIMAGSNIHPSYLFARGRDDIAMGRATSALGGALETISRAIKTSGDAGIPVIVYNAAAWPRTDVVSVEAPLSVRPSESVIAMDAAGRGTLASISDAGPGKTTAEFVARDVPAAGYRVYWLGTGPLAAAAPPQPGIIRNEFYQVSFDPAQGVLTGIYDRVHHRELIAPGGAADRMDVLWEGGGNAWDLGPIRSTTTATGAGPAVAHVGVDGSQSVTLTDHYDKSTLVHTVTLRPGIPRVDFQLDMDWQEKHEPAGGAFLKTTFDTTMAQPEAWWEIPFGAISRPAGGQEAVGLRWMDVDETHKSAAAGASAPVNLGPYWNGDAFSTSANPIKGSFDDQGMSYPAEIIRTPGPATINGLAYLLPDPQSHANQVVARGQTIELPPNQGGDLYFLGAASNGPVTGLLTLRFRDGKSQRVSLPLSDWVVNSFGQEMALEADRRFSPAGLNDNHPNIWAVRVPVPRPGAIQSIALPNDPHIHLFALTVGPRVSQTSTFGVALLNDGRYGSDIKGGVMRMSVIRSSGDPDPVFDAGKRTLRYALYAHVGGWQSSDLARQAWGFNTPLQAEVALPHDGTLPSSGSFVQVDGQSLVTTAIKQSEDGKALIVRFYNASSSPTRQKVRLTLPLPIRDVHLADMKETPIRPLFHHGDAVEVSVGPWSSVTLRIGF